MRTAILVFDGFIRQMDAEYIDSLRTNERGFRYPLKMLHIMGPMTRLEPEEIEKPPIVRFIYVAATSSYDYYEGMLEA